MSISRRICTLALLVFLMVSIFGTNVSYADSSKVLYCIGSNVNERKDNSTSSNTVRSHEKGERIHVIAEKDGWYQLTNGNWMYGKYLVSKEVAGQEFVDNSFEYMYCKGVNVNVRKGPGVNFKVVKQLAPGERVKVRSFKKGWAILSSGDYVNSDFLCYTPEEVVKYYLKKYNDIVVISLSDQFAFYYFKGKIVGSEDIVSGKDETPTPTGVFTVCYKNTDCYLMEDSFVNYFVEFIRESGIGIHDASWRDCFGRTLYHSHGSHGCVNTKYDFAEIVYNNSTVGKTKVLVLS